MLPISLSHIYAALGFPDGSLTAWNYFWTKAILLSSSLSCSMIFSYSSFNSFLSLLKMPSMSACSGLSTLIICTIFINYMIYLPVKSKSDFKLLRNKLNETNSCKPFWKEGRALHKKGDFETNGFREVGCVAIGCFDPARARKKRTKNLEGNGEGSEWIDEG